MWILSRQVNIAVQKKMTQIKVNSQTNKNTKLGGANILNSLENGTLELSTRTKLDKQQSFHSFTLKTTYFWEDTTATSNYMKKFLYKRRKTRLSHNRGIY